MQRLQFFGSGRLLFSGHTVEQVPELLQETVAAVDTIGIPRLRLLHRTKEHFIQTERVGTVFLDNHVGIHHVEHRFRHLLDGPAAFVLGVGCRVLGVG